MPCDTVGDAYLRDRLGTDPGRCDLQRGADAAGEVQVEDLGALIAQAVSILDPSKSRVLSIGALADGASTPQESLAKAINTALLSPA